MKIESGKVDPDFVWTEEIEQVFKDAMRVVIEKRKEREENDKEDN